MVAYSNRLSDLAELNEISRKSWPRSSSAAAVLHGSAWTSGTRERESPGNSSSSKAQDGTEHPIVRNKMATIRRWLEYHPNYLHFVDVC